MSNLHTTLIQTDLYWQDIDANLAMLEEKIWQIDEKTDLIILPEMFTTGFTMNAQKHAEPMNFKTFKWMVQMADQTDAAVCGSYIVKELGHFYNRFLFVQPNGTFFSYDKRHLFRMGDEHHTYSQGSDLLTIDFQGFKIRPFVCYDLRFPVWIKNTYNKTTDALEYDMLIFVANWPAPRTQVWDALLKARAMENQCFSIGVNRTGSDGEGIDYDGHSVIYDFKGQAVNKVSNKPEIQTAVLNLEELKAFRQKFPVYLDWDEFEIRG